jgi:hypothetical protein
MIAQFGQSHWQICAPERADTEPRPCNWVRRRAGQAERDALQAHCCGATVIVFQAACATSPSERLVWPRGSTPARLVDQLGRRHLLLAGVAQLASLCEWPSSCFSGGGDDHHVPALEQTHRARLGVCTREYAAWVRAWKAGHGDTRRLRWRAWNAPPRGSHKSSNGG